jgi:hypothetical protein
VPPQIGLVGIAEAEHRRRGDDRNRREDHYGT